MTGSPGLPAVVRVLLVLSAAYPMVGWAQTEAPGEEPAPVTSPYRIIRTHLPDSPGGPQMAVSLGRYIVNFGSRFGVMRGSIFQVYKQQTFAGLVRVEKVWRDSASVRVIQLEQKIEPDNPLPLDRGYRLYPKYVLLETINFGTGKPSFTPDMHDRLRYATRFILSFPDHPVVIEGHTDNTGDRKSNVALSLQRAEAIRQYLREIQRIPLDQMRTVGYADTRPIGSNGTPEGRFRNRRVDIVMLDEVEKPDDTD